MTDLEVATTEALADWIETSILVCRSGSLGVDRLIELADSELGKPESTVSVALGAISRRARVLGPEYPFSVNDVAVVRREAPGADNYIALLLLTPGSPARQTVRVSETAQMGEIFETISEEALRSFWGAGGTAIRFGYPAHGRPREFDLAIPWLAGQIGIEPGRGYRPPRRKDGGVDVVAWRKFSDNRPGFPLALAQCTIQREVSSKAMDIDLRLWSSWLAMDSDPLSLLVIPGTIRAAGPDWRQLTTVALVIERIRLIELLGRDPAARVAAADVARTWNEETLEALRRELKAAEW